MVNMEIKMACPHHPNKAYIIKDGRLVCPECGYLSPCQPVPSPAELLIENESLKDKVVELEKAVEFYKKMWEDSNSPD